MSFFIFYLYLLSVVFVFVSLKLVLWFWYRYQFLKTFSNLDILGPKPNFLTGNLKIFNKQYLFDSLGKWFDIYGDFIGYYRGNRAILVTKNPDLIYEIFIKRFQEFPNRLKFMVELQPFSSSILALRGKTKSYCLIIYFILIFIVFYAEFWLQIYAGVKFAG